MAGKYFLKGGNIVGENDEMNTCERRDNSCEGVTCSGLGPDGRCPVFEPPELIIKQMDIDIIVKACNCSNEMAKDTILFKSGDLNEVVEQLEFEGYEIDESVEIPNVCYA